MATPAADGPATRVAIIGASHWHVPLCEPGIHDSGAQITGVWDYDLGLATAFAARFGNADVASPATLADPARTDVAFIFGRPVDMADLALPFVERGIPISLEKPGGRHAGEIASVKAVAVRCGAHVSVALVQRHAGPGRRLIGLLADEAVIALNMRFVAGPPDRYRRAGCDWVLDPDQSGGGALINLGVHFIDLALALTRSTPVRLRCETSNRLYGERVEDHASLIVRMDSGALVAIEAGYGFPDGPEKRDFRVTAIGTRSHIDTYDGGLRVIARKGETSYVPVPLDTDGYYREYARNVVGAIRAGRAPLVGLAEMEAAMAIVDAAYADAT